MSVLGKRMPIIINALINLMMWILHSVLTDDGGVTSLVADRICRGCVASERL